MAVPVSTNVEILAGEGGCSGVVMRGIEQGEESGVSIVERLREMPSDELRFPNQHTNLSAYDILPKPAT